MIPLLLVLRIRPEGRRTRRLYVPLILIWVVLSPVALLVLLALCVVALVKGVNPLRVPVVLWQLQCGLRGLHVEIDDGRFAVLVKLV